MRRLSPLPSGKNQQVVVIFPKRRVPCRHFAVGRNRPIWPGRWLDVAGGATKRSVWSGDKATPRPPPGKSASSVVTTFLLLPAPVIDAVQAAFALVGGINRSVVTDRQGGSGIRFLPTFLPCHCRHRQERQPRDLFRFAQRSIFRRGKGKQGRRRPIFRAKRTATAPPAIPLSRISASRPVSEANTFPFASAARPPMMPVPSYASFPRAARIHDG